MDLRSVAVVAAALGRSIVSAQAVPVRIRQANNVEGGLNDGIAPPGTATLANSSRAT